MMLADHGMEPNFNLYINTSTMTYRIGSKREVVENYRQQQQSPHYYDDNAQPHDLCTQAQFVSTFRVITPQLSTGALAALQLLAAAQCIHTAGAFRLSLAR